ncbi:MAG: carbohydrate ABC transporter permease [Propionibacteriaceae bacterium]|jgi:multiple sugar transport system permease protein|nr:carbohydrate ABC transporter permease [Propionibacteriaceae bacterium]
MSTLVTRPRARRHPAERRSWLLTVVVLLIVAYFLLPLWWLAVASTKSNSDLFGSFGLWFGSHFNLTRNLADVFTFADGVFLKWLRNTVVYAVSAAVGSALLSTTAGYALAKLRFGGRNLFFAIIMGAIMVPMTALAIPTYLLFAKMGLTNTPWAVILPSLVSPFGVYLMRVYAADAVDQSLLESARVDGAGEGRLFFTIALRLLAPGFVTVLLFQLVATWNNYFLPLIMLNSPEWYPLTVGLAQWQATAQGGTGAQALFSMVIAGSFVSILPLIIAFLFLQRYWQSGLAAGSVKQ